MSPAKHGEAIEEALLAIVDAALAPQVHRLLGRLESLERRFEELAPEDAGLTYKQAAAALSVSPKTIRRWVKDARLARGGALRSPRIPRSEVQRLLGSRDRTLSETVDVPIDLTALARTVLSGSKR